MYWNGHGMGALGLVVMAIATLLFLALVIAAVLIAMRYPGSGARPAESTGGRSTPEQILAERYARGEIDDEEFRRRLSLLREHP